jgi:hypothetical protein
MPHVHTIYSNSQLPLSPLIRWRTGAAFSHEGLILEPDSNMITQNSIVSHSALSCKGVRFTTVKSFIAHASNYQVFRMTQQITWEQYHELVEITKKYEGLPYDLKGAIGLGIDEDWQEDDAFWCTEWKAFGLKKIGMQLKGLENEHRLDPSHSLQWPQEPILLGV